MQRHQAPETGLIAVDWGLSRFRLTLVASDGAVKATSTTDVGVTQVRNKDFDTYLYGRVEALDETGALRDAPVLLCGVIGSTIGWTDAGYVDCPASPGDVAGRLARAPSSELNAFIVPGLRCTSPLGEPDVMRGEESQILGWLKDADGVRARESLLCLPGTHTKWVEIRDGIVTRFNTTFTGELFAHLCAHSVLIDRWQAANPGAFADGLRRSFRTPAISQTLFSARSRVLSGSLPASASRDYVSGLLIGADVKSAVELWQPSTVVVVGDEPISGLYASALRKLSVDASVVDGTRAAVRGLLEISRTAALARNLHRK